LVLSQVKELEDDREDVPDQKATRPAAPEEEDKRGISVPFTL
jgi:hypothetical protein